MHKFIGDYPVFLPVVLRATPLGLDRRLSPSTEIVIEGFTRSGNTFTAFAFEQAQTRPVEMKSHVHVPSQVKLAVRRGVPTMVLLRPPLDTLTSLMVGVPHLGARRALWEYGHHHREIHPYRSGFLAVRFEEVTTDAGAVIERFNARFGTDFEPFEHTEENVQEVFAAIDAHHARVHPKEADLAPRPSDQRREQAERVRAELMAPELEELRARADASYRALLP
ncbi:MAG: hypothetical protein AAGK32_09120 [Actinomycetota bacterium]